MNPHTRRLFVVALLLAGMLTVGALPLSAQPVFEGVETNRTGQATTSLTVNVPAGAAGDLLIAVLGVKVNPSTATPSGWTAISGFGGFNQAICASDSGVGIRCQLSAFWKISDGTESSVTFTWGASVQYQAAGAVLRYSATHPTSPIGPTASDKGSGTTVTAPSITTTEANTRVLRLGLADADQAKSKLGSDPATSRFNLESVLPFGPGSSFTIDAVVIAGSDALQAAAGSSGTASWTLPTPGDQWATGTIAIRPDPGVVDADLAVTKDDGVDVANPGDTLTYTIVATNNGPSDVTGATVADTFPGDLTCSWTCVASSGAACTAGPVAGDLNDTVDLEVGATATYTAVCTIDGGATGTITNTVTITAPGGVNDTDPGNNSATDTTELNQPPVAQCQDVTVDADEMCQAEASIDDGSYDPDGDPITLTQDPPGPYGLGDTLVTLTVEDDMGLTDTCQATVTVEDNAAPVITCNNPPTITPPDAPIAFTATATDNCGPVAVEVIGYDCFKLTKKGKRVDKTESCVVGIEGATLTVYDSGGVGDMITWQVTATDGSGNSITMNCGLEVVNPGKGH